MSDLATKVFATLRRLTAYVRINGILITPTNPTLSTGSPGWDSLSVSKSLDSPVPTAAIGVNRIPEWVKRGHTVEVDLGYDGYVQRVFTGYVQDRTKGPERGTIHAMGRLYSAFSTVQVADRDVDGQTVQAAIEAILDYCNVLDYRVSVTAFTLGTASAPIMSRSTAAQMIQVLCDIDGGRIWELGSGTVMIVETNELPAPSAFRTYTTNTQATARIVGGESPEDPDYLRTRVVVTGATITEGTPPNETSRTITASALLTTDLVQPPLPAGSYIDAEMSNFLIDTDAQAAKTARRLITKYARVPREVILDIAGDPQIEIGMTIACEFPELDVTGRWFVAGVSHNIESDGYRTQLQLKGGGEYGGTIRLPPIAAFIYRVEKEVMGSAVYVVVTFDASNSFDPDGTTLTYAWSDDQVTTPELSTVTAKIFTCYITLAAAASWNVTLTVTDADGLIGTFTTKIKAATADTGVLTPAIYAALNNNASATPNGGTTWNDQAMAATIVSVAAKPPIGFEENEGIAVFGGTNGAIYRTGNACGSALTTVLAADAANGTINHFAWDRNIGDYVWGVTSTGRVLLSRNDGSSWEVYKDFGGAYPLTRILSLPGWGILVVGGQGDDSATLIQYDRHLSGVWQSIAIGGELATDLAGTAAGTYVSDIATGDWQEAAIIFNGTLGGGLAVPLYYVANLWGDGSGWTRGTGLGAAPTTGRYVVRDLTAGEYHAGFANRDVWHTTNGVAWTQAANVLPVNGAAHHALWLGDDFGLPFPMDGVYLVAVEDTVATGFGLYKSTDGLTSVLALRPATGYPAWPASAIGRMVSIGAKGAEKTGLLLALEADSEGDTRIVKLEDGVWTQQSTVAGAIFAQLSKLRNYTGGDWYHWLFGLAELSSLTAKRSGDEGLTWTDKLARCIDLARAADGKLWAIDSDAGATEMRIKYSSDDGDTWTTAYTQVVGTGGTRNIMHCIACHPANPNMIAVTGYREVKHKVWYTTDGSSFSTVEPGGSFANIGPGYHDIEVLQNDRIVCLVPFSASGSKSRIYYADSPYSSWTNYDVLSTVDIGSLHQALFELWFSGRAPGGAGAGDIDYSRDSAASMTEVTAPSLTIWSNSLYILRTNTLYQAGREAVGGITNKVRRMRRPTEAGSAWVDITANLATVVAAATSIIPGGRGLAQL